MDFTFHDTPLTIATTKDGEVVLILEVEHVKTKMTFTPEQAQELIDTIAAALANIETPPVKRLEYRKGKG